MYLYIKYICDTVPTERDSDPVENRFVCVHGEDGEGVEDKSVVALPRVVERCAGACACQPQPVCLLPVCVWCVCASSYHMCEVRVCLQCVCFHITCMCQGVCYQCTRACVTCRVQRCCVLVRACQSHDVFLGRVQLPTT